MSVTMKDALDLLNKALVLDPEGISRLVHRREQCNEALLASDLPLVVSDNGELGLLGFLNGLFADPYNRARIGAVIDDKNPDTCVVQKFVAVPR
jgi:hypothetical protein